MMEVTLKQPTYAGQQMVYILSSEPDSAIKFNRQLEAMRRTQATRTTCAWRIISISPMSDSQDSISYSVVLLQAG